MGAGWHIPDLHLGTGRVQGLLLCSEQGKESGKLGCSLVSAWLWKTFPPCSSKPGFPP